MSWVIGNDGASGGQSIPPLPAGYEWRIGARGGLELWKTDLLTNVMITSANVGEFDVNGSLRAAINTIYLEQAHSIKSSGEEVVFQNLESKVFYTPVWQFTSENGESVGEASVLVESDAPTDFYQNGIISSAGTSVACQDVYTTTENGTVYQFHAEAAEAYTGKVSLELRNSLGDAVFRLEKEVSLSISDDVVFDKLLYRVRVGNVRTFRLVKADGNELQVRGGLDPLKPWVKVVYRGFSDRAIIHVDESGKVPIGQLPQIDTVERNTVANQAARLVLPVSSKFRITIQSDLQRQFYLDPNVNPSVAGNWVDGGSVASAVTSFNSRTGNVTPQHGDYTAAQVGAVALPSADGVRRVLVGATPTAETIVDNLTSTSTTSPLSANMGRQLKEDLGRDIFLQDIYNWNGTLAMTNNQWLSYFSLPGLTLDSRSNAGSVLNGANMILPAVDGWSQVIFSMRIAGTIGGAAGTTREWFVQTRRINGTSIVGSVNGFGTAGVGVSNRDSTLVSYTFGADDPFTVEGLQLGMLNTTGQTLTLTNVSVRMQRVVNRN